VAGAVLAAVVVTEVAEIVALVLVGLGLIGVTGLVFLEVGLSEDRERERESRRAERLKHRERPRRPLERLRPRRRGH
jgi:UDP-N-acetylmuramyl pentapeptide phosphotransferase/UDP-N-acetylglucosamine-1-phosphate transferase